MQRYDDNTPDLDEDPPVPGCCQDCIVCQACVLFKAGDRVELNPRGVIALGRRLVNRGKLIEYQRMRGRLVAVVHWDGMPDYLCGKINPLFLQNVLTETRIFM